MPAIDTKSAKRWTLIAAVLGSSLAFVDGTVVNVALPTIQRSLGTSAANAQWVIEAYVLFLSALLLSGGALGDRIGRKRAFMFGAFVFVLASVACALTPTSTLLIAARAVQGVGAAFLVPGSLSLLSSAYPAAERGGAIGTWSAATGIAAAAGPVLGGFLVDSFSWHWAFLINIPVGVVLLVLCAARVPEANCNHGEEGKAPPPVDVAGTVLATIGLAGVVFALIEAPGRGLGSLLVLGTGTLGIVALVGFFWLESHIAAPMLPLKLFSNRNFAGTNMLTLLLYGALGGALYFLPLNFVQVQGMSATAAGAALLPMMVIMFLLSPWTGKLADRYGPRRPLIIGPIIAGAGFLWFAATTSDGGYWHTFFPATCLLGLGMSITVAPLTTTVMNAVDSDLAGTASGVNNAVSRTAGLLAIALFGVVMAAVFNARLDDALRGLHLPSDLLDVVNSQRSRWAGMELPSSVGGEVAGALRREIGAAFVGGFRVLMLVAAALCFLSSMTAWLTIDRASSGLKPLPRG